MRGNPVLPVERTEGNQRLPGCGNGGRRGRIEPCQFARIAAAPLRQREDHRRDVGGQHLGWIVGRPPAMPGLFPQAIGNAWSLPRGATGALGRRRLAGPLRDEVRGARCAIEFGASR